MRCVASFSPSGLLLSGFDVASRNRAQSELSAPGIRKILHEGSGQLTLRLTPVANVCADQVQLQVGSGDWQEVGIFLQARRA